jgi:CHAT domain-containing protein
VVAEDKVHILLTTAQEPQVARSVTVTGPVLNRAINDFRHVLMHPELNPLPAAQALYRFALAPVEKDLNQASATNLLVCLDGALRYVPLAALHDGKAYVAEKYRVVVLPVAEKARFLPTVPETPSWRVAGFGVTRSVNGLPALPHVREELQGIVKTADGKGGVLPGIIRLDDEFTKVELARIVKSQSPVLHIASHFVFRPGNATDSYLVLGDGDKITLDDFLHKPELKFGRTELLTLSACETAVTETRQGNGIEMDGFAEIAQRHGGAAAIMATLWDVADVSTCEFMKQFYSYHQGQPQLTKAEALQRVQVAFLNQSTAPSEKLLAVTETRGFTVPGPELPADGRLKVSYAHPYFWAPFILIGNGK